MLDLIISQKVQLLDPLIFLTFFKFFTDLGDIKTIIILLFITTSIFWYLKKRQEARLIFYTVTTSAILGTITKTIIDRPRPTPDLVRIFVEETSKSFPSNHALISLVFFGLLALFVNKKPVTIVLFFTVFLIGLSRIYLGVHWASDVLGGYLIGGAILYLTNKYFYHARR